ncbi:TetR/AcrR family transcriptional regulator [Streptomyces fuscichromogenes]|uniref:TetR/AcrR family transcriptional regulator n=1 Tax=Streptomyces fuscichromogenes TaxID=1324013 RepID=UPI00380A18EC
MPRPNVEAERRAQILRATCDVVSEVGMHDMRLIDVARRAGVSAGIIHYYFENKRALLVAAFEFNFSQSLARRRALLHSSREPLSLLARLVQSYLPQGEDVLTAWRVWAELWTEAMRDPEFQKVNDRLYDEWCQIVVAIITRAQQDGSARSGDPVELANMLVAMIDGLATQVLAQSSHMSVAKMRATLLTFIDTCLAAPTASPGTPEEDTEDGKEAADSRRAGAGR